MTVDSKVYELARHFAPRAYEAHDIEALAEAIQGLIEDILGEEIGIGHG